MSTKICLLFFMIFISNAVYCQSYEGGRPQGWNDLIGKKYTGKDQDLVSFKVVEPEVTCDYLTRQCGITWNTSSERKPPGCVSKCTMEKLTSYEINFQVLNRKGEQVFIKSYKWDASINHGRVLKMGNIPLDYTVVNYWVQNIKWKKSIQEKTKSYEGPKAFTIKEQLEAIKARELNEQ